jgi:predicted DNA binding CopG/RHH family protein
MPDKPPHFKDEAEEANWWFENQGFALEQFRKAKAEGRLQRGMVARLARERAAQAGASPTITIRLPEEDLAKAREQAAKKGLRYQTYLKMLLHEALERESKLG